MPSPAPSSSPPTTPWLSGRISCFRMLPFAALRTLVTSDSWLESSMYSRKFTASLQIVVVVFPITVLHCRRPGFEHLWVSAVHSRQSCNGEDGPTHQPIETIPSLRAIPDLFVWALSDSCHWFGLGRQIEFCLFTGAFQGALPLFACLLLSASCPCACSLTRCLP